MVIDEVLVETAGTSLRAAAVAGGELVETASEPRQLRGAPGSIYLGRVVRRAREIGGVFLELGLARPALLDVDRDPPAEGSTLAVQVIEAAAGDKGARVTRRLAIEGRLAVLIPNGKGVSVSRRVTGEGARRRLEEIAAAAKQAGEGLIVRAAATEAAPAALTAEVEALRQRWQEIERAIKSVTAPACLLDDGDGLVRLMRRFGQAPRFIFDDPATARLAEKVAARLGLSAAIETEDGDALLARYGIGDILASAQTTVLPLPSGGRLAIETTAALTAIDVDSAAGTNGAEAMLRTNLEAAAEVGRQIRLRNLGGVIVVDFLKTPAKTTRGRIEAALRRALQPDRVPVQVLGWTRAGLFEMIRTRARTAAIVEAL